MTFALVYENTMQVIKSNKKLKEGIIKLFFLMGFFTLMLVGFSNNNPFFFVLYSSLYFIILQTGATLISLLAETCESMQIWKEKEKRGGIIQAKFVFSFLWVTLPLLIIMVSGFIYFRFMGLLSRDDSSLTLTMIEKILIVNFVVFSPFTSYAMILWGVGRFLQFQRVSTRTSLPVVNMKRFIPWLLFFFFYFMITLIFGATSYISYVTGELSRFGGWGKWISLLVLVLFNDVLPLIFVIDGRKALYQRSDFVLYPCHKNEM